MAFITLYDFILLPFYLLGIVWIGRMIRDRYYPEGDPWRPYFMPGLMARVAGAIFIGLIYQYYYGGGDTANYFVQAKVVGEAFWDSPLKWFNLVFRLASPYDPAYAAYMWKLYWYEAPQNFIVISAAALIGVFTFSKFLCISAVMGAIAFSGQWAMFRTFVRLYPHLQRYLAICCLFIPSVILWGSGIFKDTLCMFGLGWITYSTFQILINRNYRISNFFLLGFSVYIIYIAKIYILLAFLPSVAMWVFLQYSHRIRSRLVRALFFPVIIATVVGGFAYVSSSNPELLGGYSTDQLLETSAITREYILSSGDDESSGYTLGAIDPTPLGMLKKLPAAVNVTLFRPYLWEARKPIVFFNALEAGIFLFLALKLLFQVGLKRIWRAITADPTIQFLLIFTVIFAFAVGISTYNFGSLSRYRIPCLPFFAMAMGLIYYRYFSPEERRFLPFGE